MKLSLSLSFTAASLCLCLSLLSPCFCARVTQGSNPARSLPFCDHTPSSPLLFLLSSCFSSFFFFFNSSYSLCPILLSIYYNTHTHLFPACLPLIHSFTYSFSDSVYSFSPSVPPPPCSLSLSQLVRWLVFLSLLLFLIPIPIINPFKRYYCPLLHHDYDYYYCPSHY